MEMDLSSSDLVDEGSGSLLQASQQFSGWDPSSIFGGNGASPAVEAEMPSEVGNDDDAIGQELNDDDSLGGGIPQLGEDEDEKDPGDENEADIRGSDELAAEDSLIEQQADGAEAAEDPVNKSPSPQPDAENAPTFNDSLTNATALEPSQSNHEDSLSDYAQALEDSLLVPSSIVKAISAESPDTNIVSSNVPLDNVEALDFGIIDDIGVPGDDADEENLEDSLVISKASPDAEPSHEVPLRPASPINPEEASVLIQKHLRGLIGRKQYGKLQLAKERQKLKIKDIKHQETKKKIEQQSLKSVDMSSVVSKYNSHQDSEQSSAPNSVRDHEDDIEADELAEDFVVYKATKKNHAHPFKNNSNSNSNKNIGSIVSSNKQHQQQQQERAQLLKRIEKSTSENIVTDADEEGTNIDLDELDNISPLVGPNGNNHMSKSKSESNVRTASSTSAAQDFEDDLDHEETTPPKRSPEKHRNHSAPANNNRRTSNSSSIAQPQPQSPITSPSSSPLQQAKRTSPRTSAINRDVNDANRLLTVVLEEVEGEFNDSLNLHKNRKHHQPHKAAAAGANNNTNNAKSRYSDHVDVDNNRDSIMCEGYDFADIDTANFDILEDSLDDDEDGDLMDMIDNRLNAIDKLSSSHSNTSSQQLSNRERKLLENEMKSSYNATHNAASTNENSFAGIPSRYAAKLMKLADNDGHASNQQQAASHHHGHGQGKISKAAITNNILDEPEQLRPSKQSSIPVRQQPPAGQQQQQQLTPNKGVRVGGMMFPTNQQQQPPKEEETAAPPSIRDLMDMSPPDYKRQQPPQQQAHQNNSTNNRQPVQPSQPRQAYTDSPGPYRRNQYSYGGNANDADMQKAQQPRPVGSPISISSVRTHQSKQQKQARLQAQQPQQQQYQQQQYQQQGDDISYYSDKESARSSSRGRDRGRGSAGPVRDRSNSKGRGPTAPTNAAPPSQQSAGIDTNRQQVREYGNRREYRVFAATTIQRVYRGYLGRAIAGKRREQLSNVDRYKCRNCGRVEQGGVYCKGCGRKKSLPGQHKKRPAQQHQQEIPLPSQQPLQQQHPLQQQQQPPRKQNAQPIVESQPQVNANRAVGSNVKKPVVGTKQNNAIPTDMNANNMNNNMRVSKGTQEELLLLKELEELDRKAQQKLLDLQSMGEDESHHRGPRHQRSPKKQQQQQQQANVNAGGQVKEKLAFKAGAKDFRNQGDNNNNISFLSKEEKAKEKLRVDQWKLAQEIERKAEEARLAEEQLAYQQQVAIERQRIQQEEEAAILQANRYKSSYLGNFQKKASDVKKPTRRGHGRDNNNANNNMNDCNDDNYTVMSSITNITGAAGSAVTDGRANYNFGKPQPQQQQQPNRAHKPMPQVQETVSLPPLLPHLNQQRQTVSQQGQQGYPQPREGSNPNANSRTKTMSAPPRFQPGTNNMVEMVSEIGDMSPVRKYKQSAPQEQFRLPPPIRNSHEGYGPTPNEAKKKLLVQKK
jgi:hypothetical protein